MPKTLQRPAPSLGGQASQPHVLQQIVCARQSQNNALLVDLKANSVHKICWLESILRFVLLFPSLDLVFWLTPPNTHPKGVVPECLNPPSQT